MKDLTGHTVLGKVKFFVTKVPFFSLLAGTLSELVVLLSVESIVSLFAIESSSVGSDCGICTGAGVGAGGGVGQFNTAFWPSLTVSGLSETLGRTLITIST